MRANRRVWDWSLPSQGFKPAGRVTKGPPTLFTLCHRITAMQTPLNPSPTSSTPWAEHWLVEGAGLGAGGPVLVEAQGLDQESGWRSGQLMMTKGPSPSPCSLIKCMEQARLHIWFQSAAFDGIKCAFPRSGLPVRGYFGCWESRNRPAGPAQIIPPQQCLAG